MTRWLWLRWVGPPVVAGVGLIEAFQHPWFAVAVLTYACLLTAYVAWAGR